MLVNGVRDGVPLTSELIKCSLGLLFTIVNLKHGTHGPGTTRNRPAPLQRSFRRRLLVRRDARKDRPSVLAGITSHYPFFFRRLLVPTDPCLCRPRLSCRRRLPWLRRLSRG